MKEFFDSHLKDYWDNNINIYINKKFERLEKRKIEIDKKLEVDNYKEWFKKLNEEFKTYEDYFSLKNEKKIIEKLLYNNVNNISLEKIKENIKDYESKMRNFINIFESIKKRPIIKDKNVNLLYKYSKLFLLIENLNKNMSTNELKEIIMEFIRVSEIKYLNQDIIIIAENEIKGLEKYISNKNDFEKLEFLYKNYKNEFISLYKRAANSMIITKACEEEINFYNFLKDISLFNSKIRNLKNVFKDNEFIYIPKLDIEDINFYFSTISPEAMNLCYKGEKEEEIKFKNIPDEIHSDLRNNFKEDTQERIKKLFIDLRELNSSIKKDFLLKNEVYDWLILPLENLKENSWKNPKKVILKKKFNLYFLEKEQIIDEIDENKLSFIKINFKSLYYLYEANLNNAEPNIYKSFPKKDIKSISSTYINDNLNYGYRLMELYNFDAFRDNISETMIIIINTIDNYLNQIFIEDIPNDIINILKDFYKEFFDKIFSEENPEFENFKIYNVFQYLLYFINRKFLYNNQKQKTRTKENFKNLTNIYKNIYNKVYPMLNEQITEYEKKKKNYENKYTKEFKKSLEIYSIKNNIQDNQDKEKLFKESNDYKDFEEEFKKNYSLPSKGNWDQNKDALDKINENINELEKDKDIDNPNKISKIIENIKFEHFEGIDKTEYNDFNRLLKQLNNDISNIADIENLYKKYDIDNVIFREEIKSYFDNKDNNFDDDSLENILEWMNKLKELNNPNIFQTNTFKKENEEIKFNDIINLNNNQYLEEYLKKGFNSIFLKDENNPIFTSKYMKIDLGLYISGFDIKEIGGITIQNHCIIPIKYELKPNKDNTKKYLIYNDGGNLKELEDLKINFKIKNSLDPKFHKFEFELILYYNEAKTDSCQIDICITSIPLILKFNLNGEKYLLENNKIYLYHHVQNLKISYKLPGGYLPKLGIKAEVNEILKININGDKGFIEINDDKFKQNEKVKYDLSLSLTKKLIDFEVEYEKPKNSSLIIFDPFNEYLINENNNEENNNNCLEIPIIKGTEKKFYIFNMTSLKKTIKVENNSKKIIISNLENNEIESGKASVFSIKDNNCSNFEDIKINNQAIRIGIKQKPKIKLSEDKKEVFCYFGGNMKENINLDDVRNFRLIIINNHYELSSYNIDSCCKNFFSYYLIENNNIIEKSNIIQGENSINYEYEEINQANKYYGFSEEGFGLFELNKLKIILGASNNKSIFSEEKIINFSKKIIESQELKKKLESSEKLEVNEGISEIIGENIILEDFIEKKQILLETNEKTSVENIIKYMMNYILNLNNSVDFKSKLEEIFKQIYPKSNRKINEYYEINVNNENLREFLKKFNYLISFILLCLSPGELLNNEINIDYGNEYDYLLEQKLNSYQQEYKYNFNESMKKEKNEQEFIYFNGKIELIDSHNSDSDKTFEKYENEIQKINYPSLDNKITNFSFDCSKEIEEILLNIKNNKINVSNLLHNLKKFKKYAFSLPVILSNEEKVKQYINGAKIIYDYMNLLKESNISKKTKFSDLINKYYKIFGNILSKFLHLNMKEDNTNISLDFIKQCELPIDLAKDIIERKNYSIKKDNDFPTNESEYQNYSINYTTRSEEIPRACNISSKNEIEISTYSKVHKNDYVEIEQIPKVCKDIQNSIPLYDGYIPSKEGKKKIEKMDFEPEKIEAKPIVDEKSYKFDEIKEPIDKIKVENMVKLLIKLCKPIYDKANEKKNNNMVGYIRSTEEMKCICSINKKINFKDNDLNDNYLKASQRLQNMISNSVRENTIKFRNDDVSIYTLQNSYVDILVDKCKFMSEIHCIASLVLCIGLCDALCQYGVKIRISVFENKSNIWMLSNNFDETNDIKYQLFRLRDALNSNIKRILSYPADSLAKLKYLYEKNTKNLDNSKYVQILISTLISPQVINQNVNWENLNQKIIIFGLKTDFKNNEFNDIEKTYLNVHYLRNYEHPENIVQEFLIPSKIIKNDILNEEKKYQNLIENLIPNLMDIKKGNDNLESRLPNENEYSIKEKQKQNKYIINEKLIAQICNNKDNKYFAQNILKTYNNTFKGIEKLFDHTFPSSESLRALTSKIYTNEKSNQQLNVFVKKIFVTCFNNFLEKNVASGKIYCSSGGSISARAFVKNWICSGFTNPNIFQKKGKKDRRVYNISYVIDLSTSIKYDLLNTISTIIILLIAPSIIEDNEEIFIDIIINTYNGVKIYDFNSKCENYQKIEKLEELIIKINDHLNYSCNPGTSLFTAYRLLLERKNDKKIFLITDGFIDNEYEIYLTYDLIKKFETNEIEFCTIGVGLYPYGLDKIFPKCCYSLSLNKLNECLSICLENSINSTSEKITPNISSFKNDFDYDKLKEFFDDRHIQDKILIKNLESEPINLLDSLFIYEESYFKEGKVSKKISNPQNDPYIDGIFENIFGNNIIRILIIILYVGKEDNDDKNINEQEFINNTGASLEKKGLKYTIVFNYKDAINELIAEENGRCKYLETWLFCSNGSGNEKEGRQIYYSENNSRGGDGKNITKEDNEYDLIPFLETVSEFNRKGGALALFCDNEPFVLEANLLLKKYLQLKNINFEMKGNYLGKKDVVDKTIGELNTNKNDKFSPEETLEPIGNDKSITRKSLRIGLVKFYEGITLSYAQKIDQSKNYEPFTPFAFTDSNHGEKPFILFYDPKIEEDLRGPIVIHGGYTSAFYEFSKDGTGKLVISIACWLARIEERVHNFRNNINDIYIPKIIGKERNDQKFTQWIYDDINVFTILILDVSGSMKGYFNDLIKMSNKIIKSQMEKEQNEGVIILFSNEAKVIKEKGKYDKLLKDNAIEESGISNGGTNFYSAFKLAKEDINYKLDKEFISKRMIFLTDGEDDNYIKIKEMKNICQEMKNDGFKLNFIRYGNCNSFQRLKELPHNYISYIEGDFEKIKEKILNLYAS